MKLSGRLSGALVLFLIFTFLVPFKDMSLDGDWIIPFAGVVLAAEEPDEEDEPFAQESVKVADPFERLNRAFFTFNDRLYFWGLKPAAILYSAYFPPGVRVAVRNAFSNVIMPIRVVNNTLQGKVKESGVELARFVINSTLGCGGLFEMASRDFDLQPQDEDFGQTLGFYGMGPVVFINWPLLGPSSLRDSFGTVGDYFLNPLSYLPVDFIESAGIRVGRDMNNVSLRIGEYEDFKKSALDPYASMRDAYLQHRAEKIRE